jgi:hypothetical protein
VRSNIDHTEVVTDVINFLRGLPDVFEELIHYTELDGRMPSKCEERTRLLMSYSRNTAIALQVVWEQYAGEDKTPWD